MFNRALEIATLAHSGEFRNPAIYVKNQGGGLDHEPYIEHPKRVAAQFNDDFTKTVAILHDVAEDAPEFLPQLKKEFSATIIDAMLVVTRLKDENYFDFIMRIRGSQNVAAMKVKLADLEDNLKTVQEGATADKYRFAKYILLEAVIYWDSIRDGW
jgi:(p)ppGpp synthase/HD superfamily hydrolase